MRKRIKEWIALLLALAVLALSLGYLTKLVTPKQHDFGSVWGHFLREKKNSVDVMFFGSSIVYCDVAPAAYWQASGLTSFVNAGPEQTLPITLEFIRQSLKTQSPRAIFVECTGVSFREFQSFTKTNIGQMPWGLPRLRATFQSAEPEVIGGLLFPMIFYHDRWAELSEDDYRGYTVDMLAGFTWLDEYKDSDLTCQTLEIRGEDWQRNADALEKICALCSSKGIELVLFRAPVERISEEDWQRLCDQFAGRDGVHLLNCLDDLDEIGAEIPTDLYDSLHYNGAGAQKFSAYLGRWTLEHLDVRPAQDQDTELWRSRLDYYENLLRTPMRQRQS